jgi:V/A-type H+-transporting ATPase subunit E
MPSLSLDDVLRKVVEDAVAEYRARIRELEEEYLRRVSGQSEELLRKASTASAAIRREASATYSRIVTQASLDARREYLAVLEDGLNSVISAALEEISKMRGSEEYASSLMGLLREAIDIVGGEDLVVECSPEDAELVKRLALKLGKERGISIRVSEKYVNSLGGVKVSRGDGSAVYNNTIEARLERMRPMLRSEIIKRLSVQTSP